MQETLSRPENQALPSKEVLITGDEIFAAVDQALDAGKITVDPHNPDDVDTYPDVYVGMRCKAEDVQLGEGLSLYDDGTGYYDSHHFEWKNADKATEEATAVQEQVRESLGRSIAPWYLKDERLEKLIEGSGVVRQAFDFEAAGKKLEMINFSDDHEISDEQLRQMSDTLNRVINSAGAGVMESVSGIAIVNDGFLNGGKGYQDNNKTIGLYQNYNSLLLLSDRLLWDVTIKNDKYGADINSTPLQTTFAHELGHAAQNLHWNTFYDALQWADSKYEVVDDYGDLVEGTRHALGVPAKTQRAFKDGKVQEVDRDELFSEAELKDVRPNTTYGASQGAEDFAESSVPYFIEGRQTDKIDPVRANAISATLHEKYADRAIEHGPYVVNATEVDLNELKNRLPEIPAQHLSVKVNVAVSPTGEKVESTASNFIYGTTTDDYGNEVYVSRPKR